MRRCATATKKRIGLRECGFGPITDPARCPSGELIPTFYVGERRSGKGEPDASIAWGRSRQGGSSSAGQPTHGAVRSGVRVIWTPCGTRMDCLAFVGLFGANERDAAMSNFEKIGPLSGIFGWSTVSDISFSVSAPLARSSRTDASRRSNPPHSARFECVSTSPDASDLICR